MNIKTIILLHFFFLSTHVVSVENKQDSIVFRMKRALSIAPTVKISIEKNINVQVFAINEKIDSNDLYKRLWIAGNDSSVGAVLLKVDNSGGPSTLSCLADLIHVVSKKKPVVALVMGSSLSAGYSFTSSANYIIAHSSSSIGSIGICIKKFKFSDFKQNGNGIVANKVTVEYDAVGNYKDLMNAFRGPLTNEQKRYSKKFLQDSYNSFVKQVAQNRMLDVSQSAQWADGKIFLPEDALKLGLIDKIGTMFDVEIAIRSLLESKYPEKDFSKHQVMYRDL